MSLPAETHLWCLASSGLSALCSPAGAGAPQYSGLDSILLCPREVPTAQKPPLVIIPRGSPHIIFMAR